MLFKRRKECKPLPEECIGLEVRVESSICTGEKTIGFYEPHSKKLIYSELVTSQKDVDDFYSKYDIVR